MIFYRFIISHYLKYFFIIFVSLELFFVFIDVLKFIDELPDSANIFILLLIYDFAWAINYTLPISLCLSTIIFITYFIKSNEYSAMLSLGYSKTKILSPITLVASLFVLISVGLNCTSLAYAQENVDSIIQNNGLQNARSDIFLKFDNKYIYIGKIVPFENGDAYAEDIKIFETTKTKNMELLSTYYEAKSAAYKNQVWRLNNVDILNINKDIRLDTKALTKNQQESLHILQNFHIKILDTFSQDRPHISIVDAIETLLISIKQNTDYKKIRAIIYSLVLVPFFVPLGMVFALFYAPALARYENISLLTFKYIIGALMIWGIFFSLSELSMSGVLNPEAFILIPFVVFCSMSLVFYARLDKKFI